MSKCDLCWKDIESNCGELQLHIHLEDKEVSIEDRGPLRHPATLTTINFKNQTENFILCEDCLIKVMQCIKFLQGERNAKT